MDAVVHGGTLHEGLREGNSRSMPQRLKTIINNTDTNDQGSFGAANNRFVAPVGGTYLFGATLLYKVNASTSAQMSGRLVLNGTTEIRGSRGESSATHVSLATAIWLQTMVPLTAGVNPGAKWVSGPVE